MATRIKKIRIKNKFTKKETAAHMGISVYQYFLFENRFKKSTSDQLHSFCKLFNVSCDYVLGLTDEIKRLY